MDDDRDLFIGAYGGVGAIYELSEKLKLFGEIRYHVSKELQTVITAGIVYPLNMPFLRKQSDITSKSIKIKAGNAPL